MKKAVLLILCVILLATLVLARSGEFVLVEKGSFTMGDTWGDGYDDEKPTRKVTFTYDFYIGN